MNRPMRLLLVVSLAAASAAVAGCGSSSAGNGSGSSSSSTSYTPLTKATLTTHLTQAMTTRHSVHMAMSMGSAMSMSADAAFANSQPKMAMTMQLVEAGKKVSVHERLIGKAAYVSIPGVTPAGKFFKITASTPELGAMMSSISGLNPDKLSASFAGDVKSLKYEGNATIDGTTVHKYAVKVDGRSALKTLGGVASATKQELSQIPATIEETLYLNSDNTMRRATMSLNGQKVTVDMTRWGEPVSVSAPPASQIAPYTGFSG